MAIVDAHHHLLDPDRIDYAFLEFLPELERFVGQAELGERVAAAGVDATVCVQAADCEDETAFMLEQCAQASFIAGVVGWVPLADPEATAKALARHCAAGSKLVGIRHLIHDEEDPDWIVRAPVPWASVFAQAASHERCVVKVSGLDMYRDGCDAEVFRPYFDHALAHFGAERMLWASNWPVSLHLRGYAELLETPRRILAGCSAAEQDAIFGDNANRVYGLGL